MKRLSPIGAALASLLAITATAEITVSRSIFVPGGRMTNGGTLAVNMAVGQPVVGTSSDGVLRLNHGFYAYFTRGDDTDGDGVPDVVENGAPNGGDGNLDGVLDALQASVASFRNAAPSGPFVGEYITLIADNGRFRAVVAVADPSSGAFSPDELNAQPVRWVDFTVSEFTPGSPVNVTVLLESGLPAGNFEWTKWGPRTLDPTPTAFPFIATSVGDNGGIFTDFASTRREFTVTLRDGEEGDAVLPTPDGVIRDPGAPMLVDVLAVTLDNFDATVTGANVTVSWTTLAETNNAGFNLYRAEPAAGGGYTVGVRLNDSMIPAEALSGGGASYSFLDPIPLSGTEESRAYFLVDVDLGGAAKRHGPAVAIVEKTAVLDWSSLD